MGRDRIQTPGVCSAAAPHPIRFLIQRHSCEPFPQVLSDSAAPCCRMPEGVVSQRSPSNELDDNRPDLGAREHKNWSASARDLPQWKAAENNVL